MSYCRFDVVVCARTKRKQLYMWRNSAQCYRIDFHAKFKPVTYLIRHLPKILFTVAISEVGLEEVVGTIADSNHSWLAWQVYNGYWWLNPAGCSSKIELLGKSGS